MGKWYLTLNGCIVVGSSPTLITNKEVYESPELYTKDPYWQLGKTSKYSRLGWDGRPNTITIIVLFPWERNKGKLIGETLIGNVRQHRGSQPQNIIVSRGNIRGVCIYCTVKTDWPKGIGLPRNVIGRSFTQSKQVLPVI